MLSVIWCDYWDYGVDEPGGTMRCIGEAAEGNPAGMLRLMALGRQAGIDAGWGAGRVVITDEDGRRVAAPGLVGAAERN